MSVRPHHRQLLPTAAGASPSSSKQSSCRRRRDRPDVPPADRPPRGLDDPERHLFPCSLGRLSSDGAHDADTVLLLARTAGTIGPDGFKPRLGLRFVGSNSDMAPLMSSFQYVGEPCDAKGRPLATVLAAAHCASGEQTVGSPRLDLRPLAEALGTNTRGRAAPRAPVQHLIYQGLESICGPRFPVGCGAPAAATTACRIHRPATVDHRASLIRARPERRSRRRVAFDEASPCIPTLHCHGRLPGFGVHHRSNHQPRLSGRNRWPECPTACASRHLARSDDVGV